MFFCVYSRLHFISLKHMPSVAPKMHETSALGCILSIPYKITDIPPIFQDLRGCKIFVVVSIVNGVSRIFKYLD